LSRTHATNGLSLTFRPRPPSALGSSAGAADRPDRKSDIVLPLFFRFRCEGSLGLLVVAVFEEFRQVLIRRNRTERFPSVRVFLDFLNQTGSVRQFRNGTHATQQDVSRLVPRVVNQGEIDRSLIIRVFERDSRDE